MFKGLLLITAILLWAGCEVIPGVNGGFKVTPIEAPDQSRWEDANFRYKVDEKGNPRTLEETKEVLRSLLRKGVVVEKAWYRQGTTSCGNLAVVVSTQMLLKISKIPESQAPVVNDLMEPIRGNPEIYCPNNVVEIKPS